MAGRTHDRNRGFTRPFAPGPGIAGAVALGMALAIFVVAPRLLAQEETQDRLQLTRLARQLADENFSEAERVEAARSFLQATTPHDGPLTFTTLASVLGRHDRLERERDELAQQIALAIEIDRSGTLTSTEDREQEAASRHARQRRLDRSLAVERKVLAVFREHLIRMTTTTPPAWLESLVTALKTGRDPAALALDLRTLGFFPTPAARRALIDHVQENDLLVALAATRSLGDQAAAMKTTGSAGPLWPEAFTRLRHRLTTAHRERQRPYRTFRTSAREHAVLVGKVHERIRSVVTDLETLLRTALSGSRLDLEALARRRRKGKSGVFSKEQLDEARHEEKQAATEHGETARILHDHDRLIRALLVAVGHAFGCLPAEARGEVETELAPRLTNAGYQTSSLHTLELAGHLHSDSIRNALVLASGSSTAEVRVAACQALGQHGRPEAVFPLSARIGDTHWQVEIAAIRALQTIGGAKAVNALVTAAGMAPGRLRTEVTAALRQLTGQDPGSDPGSWKAWWEKHRNDYREPSASSSRTTRATRATRGARGENPDDSGLVVPSTRIVYILDISSTMDWPPAGLAQTLSVSMDRRIDRARNLIAEAIALLPENVSFNVVVYNDKVKVWKRKPVPALARHREAARKWLSQVKPGGSAALFDALVHAFDPAGREAGRRLRPTDADTFVLVAAGPPTAGELAVPSEILDEVAALNRLPQAAIHTVAVGESAPTVLLQALSARNHGRFVRKTDDEITKR